MALFAGAALDSTPIITETGTAMTRGVPTVADPPR
jgi:hypothetical protein